MDTKSAQSFIFIGRSGCGKGTQANLLMEKMKEEGQSFLHVESGALLREFTEGNGYSETECKKIMNDGGLLPEFLAIGVWTRFLMHNFTAGSNLVFDGTPRKQHEAMILDSVFDFYKTRKPIVIVINVSRDWSKKHLLSRKRVDDEESDIENRLNWYDTDVVPTLDYFKTLPGYQIVEINGEQTIEQVHQDILARLGM